MTDVPEWLVDLLAVENVRWETAGCCIAGKECVMCDCGLEGATSEQLEMDMRYQRSRVAHLAQAVWEKFTELSLDKWEDCLEE